MIVADWRSLSPSQMAPLYARERERWLANLHWDYASTLADIEGARVSGQLPGFVVRDGTAIRGWSYHLLHRGTLQIGGLVASTPDITARLIGATFTSDEAKQSSGSMAFGYFDAPGVEALLGVRGLTIERYQYLEATLDNRPSASESGRYAVTDASAVAALLQHAYGAAPSLRPFARSGHADEWLEYVSQLTLTPACGRFDPSLSLVHRDSRGCLSAATLVTRIAPDAAHVAQIAVDPRASRRGLGRRLLGETMAAAREAGCVRVTLVVGDRNAAARRLYAELGFRERAVFLCGLGGLAPIFTLRQG